MDVNELAVLCKDDKRNVTALWLEVYKLIVLWAKRYCKQQDNRYSLDDLTQSAYFALLKAIDDYPPESVYKFTTYLFYHCKSEFQTVLGIRTSRCEPRLLSLDFPLPDGNGLTFGDTITNEQAAHEMDNVIESVYNRQLHTALDNALATIPAPNRKAVELRFYEEMTYAEIADTMNLKSRDSARRLQSQALVMLRRGKAYRFLREFDYHGQGLKRTSLSYFRYTFESSVEAAVLLKIERLDV